MSKIIIVLLFLVIPHSGFARIDSDESNSDKIIVIDKLRRLSKTEQFRDFPFVRDAECIGAFKNKKLLGCFWAKIVHSNIRPDLSFKVSFRNFDGKKASDLIALYQGSQRSFIFFLDYTVGIFTSKHEIKLVYRAIQGHYGLGYFGDPVAFFAVAPAISIGLPQALSWNLTLVKTPTAL